MDPTSSRVITAPYRLSTPVFMCFADGYATFLNLDTDKYQCLPARFLQMLGPWLQGWSTIADNRTHAAATIPPDLEKLAQQLVELGLLTTSTEGKDVRAIAVPPPLRVLVKDLEHSRPRLQPLRARRVFAAAKAATWELENRELADTVLDVQRQRPPQHSELPFDFERAESHARTFFGLRPYVDRDYLCMFDALALLKYLATDGIFAHWIFGVRADPFEAHCWLQEDSTVINDTIERVVQYAPILAV